MKMLHSSETFPNFCVTSWFHIPEDIWLYILEGSAVHRHYQENLISHIHNPVSFPNVPIHRDMQCYKEGKEHKNFKKNVLDLQI
jgi:hypothetical protein